MYELKVVVSKILGQCTAQPPMKPGDYITVRDGDIRIPEGGYICLWALQSMLPVLTLKERKSGEDRGRGLGVARQPRAMPRSRWAGDLSHRALGRGGGGAALCAAWRPRRRPRRVPPDGPSDLRVVVEEVHGKCTSGMQPGDYFLLRSGRIYIPADRHFCLVCPAGVAAPAHGQTARPRRGGLFDERDPRALPRPGGECDPAHRALACLR